MRNILYNILFPFFLLFLFSCEKEAQEFSGPETLYFYVQRGAEWLDPVDKAVEPSTDIEFVTYREDTLSLELKIMCSGRVKDFDRYFTVSICADSTTAIEKEHFSFEREQVIKAGENSTTLQVYLFRTADIADVKQRIDIKLNESDDFDLSIHKWEVIPGMYSPENGKDGFDARRHSIYVSDFIVKPPRWIGGVNDKPGDKELGLWGVFTEKKYRLICQEYNLVYEDFQSDKTMPSARQKLIKEGMAKKLQDLYDRGTPILEDDGRLMWFLGVSWVSYVGEPWIPE